MSSSMRFKVKSDTVIAGSALLLSVVTAFVQIVIALRGPMISALPPAEGFFYWDGNDNGAILSVALRTTLLNSSPDKGDILEEASLSVSPNGTNTIEIPFQSIVEANLSSQITPDSCGEGVRCWTTETHRIRDFGDKLVEVEAGKAVLDYLGFGFMANHCAGSRSNCMQYADFARAIRSLDGKAVQLTMRLQFHSAKTTLFWWEAPTTLTLACNVRKFSKALIEKPHYYWFECLGS